MLHSEYLTRREQKKEWAKWLASAFGSSDRVALGTFTFRNPTLRRSWTRPGMLFVNRARRQLEEKLDRLGSTWFACVEAGSLTSRLHIHCLSDGSPQHNRIVRLWWHGTYGYASWRYGSSRSGVSLYCAKYVAKSDGEFGAGGPGWRH